MERLAVVGSGQMGRPIALNLLAAVYPLKVGASRPNSPSEFTSRGAEAALDFVDLADAETLVGADVRKLRECKRLTQAQLALAAKLGHAKS